ncbi:hypothetical protein PVAP13_7NG134451 [Panicum virgatum]|uniref:Uncharacterized protein n=1 Tax=Panicum virgatum TaxID=38727 RepID=A0A8T0PVJ6_PANVG|nr:hypothetical protein PVAP13_7NG134451 [Panicum virgatum]
MKRLATELQQNSSNQQKRREVSYTDAPWALLPVRAGPLSCSPRPRARASLAPQPTRVGRRSSPRAASIAGPCTPPLPHPRDVCARPHAASSPLQARQPRLLPRRRRSSRARAAAPYAGRVAAPREPTPLLPVQAAPQLPARLDTASATASLGPRWPAHRQTREASHSPLAKQKPDM